MKKTSKYRGVYKSHGKWSAFITVKGQDIGLGTYKTEDEAHNAVVVVSLYIKPREIRIPNYIEGEIWRDVVGFEGRYMVSNLGRIKSMNFGNSGREGLMKIKKEKNGYERICLQNRKSNFSVHRVVYESFCGKIPDDYVIHHKNSIRDDNRVENLECVNQRENVSEYFSRSRGFVGAYYDKKKGKWTSLITVDRKQIYLGAFDTKSEALSIYKKALKDFNKKNKFA